MATLNVSLPKELKEFVDDQVSAGSHSNASAFIAALVRAERKRRAAEKLLALVKEADESGPSVPWTPEDMDRIRAKGMRRRAEEKLLALVKEGDESGSAGPMTAEDWERIRREIAEGIAKRKKKARKP